MRRAKSGQRVWKDFRVRVVLPDQKPILWRSHAPPARGYTAKGIEEMLDQVAEHLEQRFPSAEFRLVELAPNSFNFIYEGRKGSMGEKLQVCPEKATAKAIATLLCAVQGHDINTFQMGMTMGPQGQQLQTATYCKKCGLGHAEIRGDLDVTIQHAVEQERQRQASAAPPPAPNAKGPIAVPPKAEVESPS